MFQQINNIFIIALCVSLGACKSSGLAPDVPLTGFIPSTVTLTQASDDTNRQTFRAPTLDIAKFTSANVMKTQMKVKLDDLKREEALPRELRSNLQQFVGMPTSDGTAAGTLVIHAAITGARPDNPLIDLGTNQPTRGDGGYTGVEIFATDGMSGPVVAAMARTVYSHKLTLGSNAAWARTEKALQIAAEEFAKLLKPGLQFPQDR